MVFAFGGILALRRLVDDPVRRATWSAVATIIAFIDVPIVYFSVKWWNSLHQLQSSPETVSSAFHWPLRINAFGILFLMSALIALRGRVAALRLRAELAPPPAAASVRTGGAVALLAVPSQEDLGLLGEIHGGWEYVWAAYALSAAILIGYAASVYVRYRHERRRAVEDGTEAGE
jgi:hypothetical protein